MTTVQTKFGEMSVHADDQSITRALEQIGVWEPAETASMQATLAPV